MNEETYQPIACADYDIYEIAIMRKSVLGLVWVMASGELMQEQVRPLELKIMDGAEYLLYLPVEDIAGEAQMQNIRLDKIKQAELINKQ